MKNYKYYLIIIQFFFNGVHGASPISGEYHLNLSKIRREQKVLWASLKKCLLLDERKAQVIIFRPTGTECLHGIVSAAPMSAEPVGLSANSTVELAKKMAEKDLYFYLWLDHFYTSRSLENEQLRSVARGFRDTVPGAGE
jgi:hypothetical protein